MREMGARAREMRAKAVLLRWPSLGSDPPAWWELEAGADRAGEEPGKWF